MYGWNLIDGRCFMNRLSMQRMGAFLSSVADNPRLSLFCEYVLSSMRHMELHGMWLFVKEYFPCPLSFAKKWSLSYALYRQSAIWLVFQVLYLMLHWADALRRLSIFVWCRGNGLMRFLKCWSSLKSILFRGALPSASQRGNASDS